ncbi:hypothetical protein SDC9_195630 [bioreactor metagenome]|uniref:Uncharacterized protein n=1 Tax=bioreactor metagenome TaxID=1076179 RepID=A0A645IAT5_9ZZZZ
MNGGYPLHPTEKDGETGLAAEFQFFRDLPNRQLAVDKLVFRDREQFIHQKRVGRNSEISDKARDEHLLQFVLSACDMVDHFPAAFQNDEEAMGR